MRSDVTRRSDAIRSQCITDAFSTVHTKTIITTIPTISIMTETSKTNLITIISMIPSSLKTTKLRLAITPPRSRTHTHRHQGTQFAVLFADLLSAGPMPREHHLETDINQPPHLVAGQPILAIAITLQSMSVHSSRAHSSARNHSRGPGSRR